MSRFVEAAGRIVDQLVAAGVKATTNPQEVVGMAPCVLIAPPALTLQGARFAAWPLYVIAGRTVPDLATWQLLDDLVDQVDELLPLAAARPASWAPSAGVDPMPAYLLTYEEAIA